MSRKRLSDRRRNETRDTFFEFAGPQGPERHKFMVTVGFYARSGETGEVFAAGPKTGSMLRSMLEDACVLASICRQAGLSFEELAPRLGRDGVGNPTSPIGAILQAAARIELGLPEPEETK